MRISRGLFAFGLVGLFACGDSESSGSGASGTGAGSTGPSGGAGGDGASGGSGGAGAAGASGGGGIGGIGGGLCEAIDTFAAGLTPTAELFVSTTGSANGDGSMQSPFADIEQAIAVATPGTAVRILPGTYAGGAFLSDVEGTAAAPIWIGGVPGEERPVFSGGGTALQISGARYLVLHDLEVANMTDNGVNIDDTGAYDDPEAARFISVERLHIHDIGDGGNQDCLKLSGLNDFWVLDSTFEACSGSAIDHVGCHDGKLARNTIRNGVATGIQAKGGSANLDIERNVFESAGERAVNMGGSTGFEFFRPPLSTTSDNAEATNIRVFANVIVGSTSPLAYVGCVDCAAFNNTIIDPENWIFRVLQETTTEGGYTFLPAQNGVFDNNLVYFSRADLSGQDINVGADTLPETFTGANNLWYAHDDPTASAPVSFPGTETGSIVGEDPLMIDAADGIYSIGGESPAFQAGTATAVGADVAGQCYLSPPSIGAFEVVFIKE